MSDFFEEEKDNLSEQKTDDGFESTIFSAPAEHKDKAPRAAKKRLTSIIAACLAVAVLIGGTIAVIKLIPEMKEDEAPTSVFEDIKVIETDSSLFETVTVTNENGEFKFVKQQITSTNDDGEDETTDYWGVEGIDISKLSSSTINTMITDAADIIAMSEVNGRTAADCGLDTPKIKVTVEADSKDPYTILVGGTSVDNLGSYMMIEGIDTIYVAADSEFSNFGFSLVDLADKTSIPATVFTADTSENKSEDGAYAYFDSLTLSGKLFPETITIVNNSDDTDSAELVPYLIKTPTERYANSENLNSLVNLFSNEISVAGCYAFDINDQTLKEFGLDTPDAVISMTIEGETKTFKLSKIDDEYCAIIYDDATMIRKSAVSNFAFMSLKPENLYLSNLFMHSINDVSALKLTTADADIKFDISYEVDDDDKKTYSISCDGKAIVTETFQDFYADLIGIQCSDFTTQEISGKADGTVTFVFSDNSKSVVEFYKVNDTQYQYSIDSIKMGKITSAAYNKMVKTFNDTAAATK